MTSTKRTPRFTEEEKAVLKNLRKIKIQISKEMMKEMSHEEYIALANNAAVSLSKKRTQKRVKTTAAKQP